MKAKVTTIIAVFTAILLLTVIVGASAYTPLKNDAPCKHCGDAEVKKTISPTKTFENSMMKKAAEALEEAEKVIEEAQRLLEEAESKGVEIQLLQHLKGILSDAEDALEKAKETLDKSPSAALALAKRAEALAKSVKESIESALKSSQTNTTATETVVTDVKEKIEELRELLDDLTAKAGKLANMGIDVAKPMEFLGKAKVILDQLEAQTPENVEEILEHVEELLKKAEELLRNLSVQTKAKTSTGEITLVNKTFTVTMTHPTATAPTTHIEATTMKTATKKTITSTETWEETLMMTSTTTTLPFTSSTKVKEVKEEVKVEVGGEREKQIVIEQTMQITKYANGTTVIMQEKIMAVGNKTFLKISKIHRSGDEQKIEHSVVIERNQTILGALVNVRQMNVSTLQIDKNLTVSVLERERNKFRLRLSAPDGTLGRLIVVELEPDAVDLNKLQKFEVIVNGKPAILASGIIDLASGVYDEPAYVFVISSKGASILLYIPHFSEYTVDILGVIGQAASTAASALQSILSNTSIATSTLAATAVLLLAAAITMKRRRLLWKL